MDSPTSFRARVYTLKFQVYTVLVLAVGSFHRSRASALTRPPRGDEAWLNPPRAGGQPSHGWAGRVAPHADIPRRALIGRARRPERGARRRRPAPSPYCTQQHGEPIRPRRSADHRGRRARRPAGHASEPATPHRDARRMNETDQRWRWPRAGSPAPPTRCGARRGRARARPVSCGTRHAAAAAAPAAPTAAAAAAVAVQARAVERSQDLDRLGAPASPLHRARRNHLQADPRRGW